MIFKINSSFLCLIFLFIYHSLSGKDVLKVINNTSSSEANIYENYLRAELALLRNDFKKSSKYFKSILNNDIPEVKSGYLRLLFKDKRFDEIEKQPDLAGGDIESKVILFQTYLKHKKFEEASKLIKNLVEQNPENEQIVYFSVMLNSELGKVHEALDVIDKFLKIIRPISKHFVFYFIKAKLLAQINKINESIDAINESLQLYPKFDQGWKFKALLSEQFDKRSEAISAYQRLLDIDPKNIEMLKRLISLLFKEQRYKDAKIEVMKLKEDSAEYFFDMALIEYKIGDYDEALANLEKSLKLDSDFNQSKILTLEILLAKKDSKKLFEKLDEWISQDPDNYLVLKIISSFKKSAFSDQEIMDFYSKILQKHHTKIVLSSLVDLMIQFEHYKEALNLIEDILKITTKVKDLSELYALKGQILFKLKDDKTAEIFLKKALEFNPDLSKAQNLLAYLYGTSNKNLAEALALINKALDKNNLNPAYLDTKGFILYKMGEKQKAKEAYEAALITNSQDKVIKYHLNLLGK